MCSLRTEKIRLRLAIALALGTPRTGRPRGASRRSVTGPTRGVKGGLTWVVVVAMVRFLGSGRSVGTDGRSGAEQDDDLVVVDRRPGSCGASGAPVAQQPVARSNACECSGQITTRASIWPSASGPPRCGQTAPRARTLPSSAGRRRSARRRRRRSGPRPSGIWSSGPEAGLVLESAVTRNPQQLLGPTARHLRQHLQRQRGAELAGGHRISALGPGVDVAVRRAPAPRRRAVRRSLRCRRRRPRGCGRARPAARSCRCAPATWRSPGSTAGSGR